MLKPGFIYSLGIVAGHLAEMGLPQSCHYISPTPSTPVIPDPKHGEHGSNPEKRARKKAMEARKRRIQR